MVNSIQRDQNRRFIFLHFEAKRVQYKALLQDSKIGHSTKNHVCLKMYKTPRNSSQSRVRRRCIYTGRPRGVLRACRISRILFRELASQGRLNGVQKASW